MARGKGSTLQCENLDSNRCHWLVAKPIPTHHPSNASFSCNLFGIMPHQVASANAETWQKHENCPGRAKGKGIHHFTGEEHGQKAL